MPKKPKNKNKNKRAKVPPARRDRSRDWRSTRAGARAGRGFRFQDLVATTIAAEIHSGVIAPATITPEGWDDLTLADVAGIHYIQVKSRQPHLGPFSVGDLVDFILDGWGRHADHLGVSDTFTLVLEQPVLGVNVANITVGHLPDRLRRAAPGLAVDRLLQQTRLRVLSDPLERSATTLAQGAGGEEAHFLPHVQALRSAAGAAADANANAARQEPTVLTPTDIARIVRDTSQAVDPSVLVEALRRGVCDVPDFASPTDDFDFYHGVDATPGHVGAGLVFTRPEVERELDVVDNRPALITGPSGSGKSSALYLIAYLDRSRRWFRIRQLGSNDVADIVSLARGLQPGRFAPIGFVVDNVGRPGVDAWDELVVELSQLNEVRLLGAARAEDLSTLGNIGDVRLISLDLSEDLAAFVFEQLSEREQTTWHHWREPLELSQGLLLEYVHILTQGQRLDAVVGDQVRRRLREHRDDELAVLAVAATATAWDAELPIDAISRASGVAGFDLARALGRLIDEHLLQRRDGGTISALHRLRSLALFSAVHLVPPPTEKETLTNLISHMPSDRIQTFLEGVLYDRHDLGPVVIDAVASRLRASLDVPTAAAALQALRLADFRGEARDWVDVMERKGVPPALRSVTANLAIAGLDAGRQLFQATIVDAAEEIAARNRLGSPLRDALAGNCNEALMAALAACTDLRLAAEMLAALKGTSARLDPTSFHGAPFVEAVAAAGVDELSNLIAAASGVSLAFGTSILDMAGGERAVLDRIEAHHDWLQDIEIVPVDDESLDGRASEFVDLGDRRAARTEYRYVSDLLQPDIHATCIDIATQIAASAPDIDLIRIICTDATGELHGFRDLEIVNKWLRRRVLPSAAEVAWNRARSRVIEALLATKTRTDRALAELALLESTVALLDEVSMHWLRNSASRSSLNRLNKVRFRILADVNELPPLHDSSQRGLHPLELGTLQVSEPVEQLIRDIAGPLVATIAETDRNYGRLTSQARSLHARHLPAARGSQRWRLLGDDIPLAAFNRLNELLGDVHAVAAEATFGVMTIEALARVASHHPDRRRALSRAAARARESAEMELDRALCHFRGTLELDETSVVAVMRPADERSLAWPPLDVLVLIRVDRVDQWTKHVVPNLVAARSALPALMTLEAAPLRNGRLIDFFGVAVHRERLFDKGVSPAEWPLSEDLVPMDGAFRAWAKTLSAAVALSSISTVRALSEGEAACAESLAEQLTTGIGYLSDLAGAHPDDDILPDVLRTALDLASRVSAELDHRAEGPNLAAQWLHVVRDGVFINDVLPYLGVNLVLAEWDASPQSARELVDDLSHESGWVSDGEVGRGL